MNPRHLLNLMGDRLYTLPLLVLYLTDGCNSRCVTCDIWRNPRRNMSMAMVEKILGMVDELQTKMVLLSGGEAMQHPQWPEIIQRFKAKNVYVMLLTNGLLLRKQAQDVIASGVDEVIVSLDGGTAATYEAIRGVDGFDLILDGIGLLRQAGVDVATRSTIQRDNYHEMSAIIEAGKQLDVNRISFLTVDVSSEIAFGPRFEADSTLRLLDQHPASALTSDDITQLSAVIDDLEVRFAEDFRSGRIAESPAKLRRMLTYFKAVIGEAEFEAPRCNAPHISTVIEVDGTLRPCYFLPASGKLNGMPLASAINGDPALALRRAYRSGERPECARCVCPLYKGPRSLLNL